MQADVSVVLVEGTLNNLGVIRSLSSGGMPIYVLGTTRNCAAGWSRYCTFIRIPSLKGDSLISSLLALGKKLGNRPVLIPGGDQSVETVSVHRDAIETYYRLSMPSPEVVRSLADKSLFQSFAEREGLPVPRAVTVADLSDLGLLESLIPPLILKPADKTLVIAGQVERALRAQTLAEARNCVVRMLPHASKIIVQEWVDGPDNEIFFSLFSCNRESNLIGIFTGRKLVCSPPEIGVTAICVSAPEVADELRELVIRFVSKVKYRGLGSLEFKRDSRTGRFIVIEPTVGRADWQEEIATLSGVNLPLLTYRAELGLPTSLNGQKSLPVAWRSSAEHKRPPGRSLSGTRIIDGFFRWSDPLPALYYYGLERFLYRIWRRSGTLRRQFTGLQERRTDG
jgi:D-aspartate ligase